METRLLILNSDPVFEDDALALFDMMDHLERRIVRTLSEAIYTLMRERFDLFVVEGEAVVAIEQATNARQHFPSLEIVCLTSAPAESPFREQAEEQKISLVSTDISRTHLRRQLRKILINFERFSGTAAEGIDPCHSLVGNLNQFSAAEILQMSCMSQRSGRFTFKSGRGNSEIYLHHGIVRHAVYGTLEGEAAIAETFRWRQGRFYFEEGIISQIQTVDRPWAHLLIDNLQKLDETLEMVGVPANS
ncbi:MAG TPA: DUF4388 domain-containing protein [Chthoniobacterales bacterium]|nr:DUF4388 domain-containing protein [Chthoniobacterales bacterium]